MVTPYPGRGLSVEKNSFNFYQSRVRINIKCAFGMLHARWGILWKLIRIRLDRIPTLIGALVVLHNMCIDDQGSQHSPSMDGACFSSLAGEGDASMAPTSQGSVYSDYVEAAAVSGARRDLERFTQRGIMSFKLAQNKNAASRALKVFLYVIYVILQFALFLSKPQSPLLCVLHAALLFVLFLFCHYVRILNSVSVFVFVLGVGYLPLLLFNYHYFVHVLTPAYIPCSQYMSILNCPVVVSVNVQLELAISRTSLCSV